MSKICTTFLIEKKAELGGLASVISKIPDKKRLADFPNYMIHRASKLHNLFIFKNTSATPELVKSLNPDIIVNATGSVPTLPPITGLHDLVDKDDSNVATVLKMIDRINEYPEKMDGQKVAIIGGGAVGQFVGIWCCRNILLPGRSATQTLLRKSPAYAY